MKFRGVLNTVKIQVTQYQSTNMDHDEKCDGVLSILPTLCFFNEWMWKHNSKQIYKIRTIT